MSTSTTAPASKKPVKKVLLAILGVLLLIAAIFGIRYARIVHTVNTGLQKNKVSAISTPTSGVKDIPTDSENVLVVGSDIRDVQDSSSPGARSDTMMIVHLTPNRENVTAVSIPRDLMVKDMPDCVEWNPVTRQSTGKDYQFGSMTQSNAAFAVGGPACAVTLAEHLSGVKISRYVEVDFHSFQSLVDSVGGVRLNICKPMIDTNNGDVIFDKPGVYNVDGKKALQFARARHLKGSDGSDTYRMKRQQFLVKQLIEQKVNSSLLSNPEKVNDLAGAFVNNSRTDNVDMNFLVGTALKAGNLKDVETMTLPSGEWDQDTNRLVSDDTTNKWLFQQIMLSRQVTEAQAQAKYREQTGLSSTVTTTQAPQPTTRTQPRKTEVAPSVTATPTSDLPCAWG